MGDNEPSQVALASGGSGDMWSFLLSRRAWAQLLPALCGSFAMLSFPIPRGRVPNTHPGDDERSGVKLECNMGCCGGKPCTQGAVVQFGACLHVPKICEHGA